MGEPIVAGQGQRGEEAAGENGIDQNALKLFK
jgi:hypothetical protein